MKEYKLKIDSSETYLVDSDPTKVVESFLDTLPGKNKPWIQTTKKDGREATTYHGVCPYCNNPITLVGYETRNSLSPKPYMKHYTHSVRKLAEYTEGNYNKCILASKNLSSFGNTDKKRVRTDDISIGILNTVKTQLDRIFYILTQDTGINFSKSEAIFLKEVKREKTPPDFKDLWLFKRDVKDEEITFPDGEATEFKWVSIDKFIEMFNNKEIVPTIDFGREEYELALKANKLPGKVFQE